MAQPFMTYDQQIDKLVNEKGLSVPNRKNAIKKLHEIGYFALISGYKDLFKDKSSKKYIRGARFDDIVALYNFDANLRELFMKYILKIEKHIASLLSYYFTEKHGENQSFYLDGQNYNNISKNQNGITELTKRLHMLASSNTDY